MAKLESLHREARRTLVKVKSQLQQRLKILEMPEPWDNHPGQQPVLQKVSLSLLDTSFGAQYILSEF